MIDGPEAQALQRSYGGRVMVIKLDLKCTAALALIIGFVFDRLQGITDLIFERQRFS